MGILPRFRSVVRDNDFIEVGECQDGTTSWFRKASTNMRLCVDGVTNSATVFWASSPGQLASKTFRTVSSLKDWFALKVGEHIPPSSEKNDRCFSRR
jgi:predicted ATP-dependent Lon-type protease